MGVATIASEVHWLVWSKTVTEDGLGFVLLQRGSLFDDRHSINRSAVFENQLLWITPSSISPKLIKAVLEQELPLISSCTQARLKLIVAVATIRINTVPCLRYFDLSK